MKITRSFWVWLHRWTGLAMAGFLIVVGLTGALLAFLPELNHLLTPQLFPGPHAGVELDAATLALRAEALEPRALVNTVYLGDIGTARIGMSAKPGAPPLDFTYLCLDSVTGAELGHMTWNDLPTSVDRIMPFVYALHYELAMGDVGAWILGFVALAWTLDCFVGFYLTFPRLKPDASGDFLLRWKPAWLVKFASSFYRINFDLHRAGGLWFFAMLLIFAWSSVFWNLNGVYTWTTQLFFDFQQPMWARSDMSAKGAGMPMGWERALATGKELMNAQARDNDFIIERPLALYISREQGLYEYRVRSSRDISDKYGSTSIHFDAVTGVLRWVSLPTGQRLGNTITTWLADLHMANVFGLPYRILVCVLGLVIAMLSVTGVYIWWKKRRARHYRSRRPTEPGAVLDAHLQS